MGDKQLILFRFIKAKIVATGVAPTFSEIREHLDTSSTQLIQNYLDGMEKGGYIKRIKGKLRGIQLTEKGQKFDTEITQVSEPKDKLQIPVYDSLATSTTGQIPSSMNIQLDHKDWTIRKGGGADGTT